ncbi:NB-ARC domain-containing protein [Saccharothrix sp. S26]|uniref:AfsR/SARP family transcriptional regulator n=1 Tax=Saccharothrix sp. S26 TaxID=2907215 RepID=UPI001F2513D4|nr:BTAD domain-containing putative transcriptional regulator [Saccharothrix sp. S26]MCE6996355.1 NB-ARC domain-containing protein [Saccharothrix sp. S26]
MGEQMLRIGLLGPLTVHYGGNKVAVRAGKQRVLLTALALRAGRVVGTDELIDSLWPDEAVGSSRSALQVHMARLRGTLTATAPAAGRLIETLPMGYALRVNTADVDLLRFGELVHKVQQQWQRESPTAVRDTITEALALWRGPALADIPGDSLRDHAQLLTEQRLTLLERRFELDLVLGRHEEVIGELRAAVRAHPLREPLWGHLMRALCLSGRKAEALETYRQLAEKLEKEVGVAPDEALRELYGQILSGTLTSEPARAVVEAVEPPASATTALAPRAEAEVNHWPVLCALPPDVHDFVGRSDELRRLEKLLTETPPRALPIVNVTGSPGVGKTALAVRAAHDVRLFYPDGQWFVRLGATSGSPRDPADVLAELLRSSGTSSAAIPQGLDARAAMFRARVADRRVLLLFDDAQDADQVAPLLPGTPGCAVVVTSRSTLSDLLVLHGARIVVTGILSVVEGRRLLEHNIGDERVVAEPDEADELVELCACLPLALRVAAASLAVRPTQTLRSYVADLRDGNRIAKLTVGNTSRAAVQAAFDLSYQLLSEPARRLFRRLGLVPGPSFTPTAAAVVAGLDVATATRLLDELAVANLIEPYEQGRYRFHELLRLYAVERGRADDSKDESQESLSALLEWYLHTAASAVVPRYPGMIRIEEAGSPPELTLDFGTDAEALDWLHSERPNLVAAITAAEENHGPVSWLLTDVLRGYFWSGWHSEEWQAAANAGLRAAIAAGDHRAQWAMHYSLGLAHYRIAEYPTSLEHLTSAEAIAERSSLPEFAAETRNGLGIVLLAKGRLTEARQTLARGIALDRELDLPLPQARAHRHLGTVEHALGAYAEALAHFRAAIEIDERFGVEFTRSENLGRVGLAQIGLGREEEGLAELRASLAASLESGSRFDRAAAHCRLATASLLVGDPEPAGVEAREGRALAADLGDRAIRADAWNVSGAASRALGQVERSIEEHEKALEVAIAAKHAQIELEARLGLAISTRVLGRLDASMDHLCAALALVRRDGLTVMHGHVLVMLAATLRAEGRTGEAARLCQDAAATYRRGGHRWAPAVAESLPDASEDGWARADRLLAPVGTTVMNQAACGFES